MEFKRRCPQFEREVEEAFAGWQRVDGELKKLSSYDLGCEDLKQFAGKFKKTVEGLTYEQKQRLADMLVESVEVRETDTERLVKVKFRFDPKAITSAIPTVRTSVVQHKAEKPLKELPHHATW
ncbi:hypothetical protein COU76_01540 [Candidatus Peregrinibacteria bacterium CG10_big_fil_rev_8_21_14_0_10_49_10]|nr:MAG: hypothetical protein COU76_01540 [Candidatus Peregrinibacteria bacterium CG10_big_fil_rev_8_21_14_0_10_49_10]